MFPCGLLWFCDHRACISIHRRKNRHGHWVCCMSTGSKNGLMWRTNTHLVPSNWNEVWLGTYWRTSVYRYTSTSIRQPIRSKIPRRSEGGGEFDENMAWVMDASSISLVNRLTRPVHIFGVFFPLNFFFFVSGYFSSCYFFFLSLIHIWRCRRRLRCRSRWSPYH